MINLFRQIQATAVSLLLFSLLLGGVYPLLVTAILQTAFPASAEGSLIRDSQGQVVGSSLIGQSFSRSGYMWGRLSATGPQPYNAEASSGSNLGVNNPALLDNARARLKALGAQGAVPVDLVTSSASGLDPDISPAAAAFQVPRIARARHVPEATVRDAIARSTKGRTFGLLGEPRVNVLDVNLRLDGRIR